MLDSRTLDAIELAYVALVHEARAAHAETIPGPGRPVTNDLCSCGQSTSVGQTLKCKALRVLDELLSANGRG